MYDSNYLSNKKRGAYVEDNTCLPTAERSQYRDYPQGFLDKTPTRLQYHSPSKRSDKLSQARKSINQAIDMMSSKKSLNREAIDEVRNVNQEIISSLTAFNPAKSNPFQQRNRTADYNRDDSRDFVATSQFQWQSPDQLHRSQKGSVLGNENVELRSKLNEEIKKNNDLIKYIRNLQSENVTLRNTNQGSSANNILEQNKYLRNQLSASQSANYGIPVDLLQELRRLKEQNQGLRRDTITLLKGKPY